VIAARGPASTASPESEDAAGERRSGGERRRVPRKGPRDRGRRAPADSEDAEARREAGLSGSPTAFDSEPEQESSEDGRAPEGIAAEEADEFVAEDARKRETTSGKGSARSASDSGAEEPDEPAGADDVQSKPRRRGRRGGRRRSAARAKATPK
jgi:ribonuclease G